MKHKSQTIVIDMDGTICTEEKTFEKSLAKPQQDSINYVNALYSKYNIIIYTARSWSERKMTEQWLQTHNIKYDTLMCGKPIYDYWIDDRAIGFTSWKEVAKKINQ